MCKAQNECKTFCGIRHSFHHFISSIAGACIGREQGGGEGEGLVQLTYLLHSAILSSSKLLHREACQLTQNIAQLWQEMAPAVAGLWQQAEGGDPAVSGSMHCTDDHGLAVSG